MSSISAIRATLDDLLVRVEGKAELIGGKLVQLMPSGYSPSVVAFEIAVSLRQHAKVTGRGVALGDGIGYAVPELPSGRESFSPDASYYNSQPPTNVMPLSPVRRHSPSRFSENDYARGCGGDLAAKRADYFDAGTLAAWDVDPRAETVTLYRVDAPDTPVIYRRGDVAEAGLAVPGWRMAVDDIFAV